MIGKGAFVVLLSVLVLAVGQSEARRGSRSDRENARKAGITWYGPVTSEAECTPEGKLASMEISNIKERKPKELCADSTTPMCICQSVSGKQARRLAKRGEEAGYKMRCSPCEFSWNWRKFKREDNTAEREDES